jgi:hypothetical protein
MTKKERVFVLTLIITMFGFSVFGVIDSNESKNVSQIRFEIDDKSERDGSEDYQRYRNSQSGYKDSKIIDMLSEVLQISKVDIWDSLNGGMSASEILYNSGVLLSDLEQEYNFTIVHDQFVKFS